MESVKLLFVEDINMLGNLCIRKIENYKQKDEEPFLHHFRIGIHLISFDSKHKENVIQSLVVYYTIVIRNRQVLSFSIAVEQNCLQYNTWQSSNIKIIVSNV